MNPILSILTPSIPSRTLQAAELSGRLTAQIGNEPVEHLIFSDNRMRSIGAKRQALVDFARGDYIAFVDDDDDVSDTYIERLLSASQAGADCITFHQRAIYNGLESEIRFGLKNQDQPFNPGGVTLRAPWHVCAWKRSLVVGCQFLESNYGEDIVWCAQARQRIKNAIHISEILHTYRHDAATTAAPENRLSR